MLLIKLTPVIPLLLQITCNKQLHWSACGNWYTGCTLVIWNFFQYNCIVLKIFVIFIINENIVFGHTDWFCVIHVCISTKPLTANSCRFKFEIYFFSKQLLKVHHLSILTKTNAHLRTLKYIVMLVWFIPGLYRFQFKLCDI